MIRKIKSRIEEISPLQTPELLSPNISLCSNQEAFVEGCFGIIEYNTELIRINCKPLILKITGEKLTIKAEANDRLNISGNILSLDFTGV